MERGERARNNQGMGDKKNGPAEEPSGNLGAPAWMEHLSKSVDRGREQRGRGMQRQRKTKRG